MRKLRVITSTVLLIAVCMAVFAGCRPDIDTRVTGTYIIWAEYSGNIYYDFTVNTCSSIRIDARTGEILYENYWDGRIT